MQSFFMWTVKSVISLHAAQSNLSVCWAHMSESMFSHVKKRLHLSCHKHTNSDKRTTNVVSIIIMMYASCILLYYVLCVYAHGPYKLKLHLLRKHAYSNILKILKQKEKKKKKKIFR